jgi:hypothetical protein
MLQLLEPQSLIWHFEVIHQIYFKGFENWLVGDLGHICSKGPYASLAQVATKQVGANILFNYAYNMSMRQPFVV